MAIAKVKKYFKRIIITTVIVITLLSGCNSSLPTPPSTTNNTPTISAPDSLSFDEGAIHSFNVDVTDEDGIDELTFSGECDEYFAGFNSIAGDTVEVVLTPKEAYKNFNGVSNLRLTVEDSQGATTQKDITLNVIDTPDVEFYNMPSSASVEKGETKEITGYIRDDYTPLEELVLNASCENADVNIEKIGGEEIKININANKDYIGNSQIVLTAADDEGNSSSYNLPIVITTLANNPPAISAPNSLSFDEGLSHSFNVDVYDEDGWEDLRFSAESNEYSTYLITEDEDTMNITLTPKEGYKNFNGVSNLNLAVEDSQGATTQKDITLNVIDTPDVEFYNMPNSASLTNGETTEVTGYIIDDYTPLEELVLNASCENADVNIEKIGGEEFKININANKDYIGNSQIVLTAADDEGNSNSYNLPITIIPLVTRTLDVHLDFDGVNVDDGGDDIIDSWYEVPDIGPVLVSAYKVPVTSYDEYTVSTEFPELDSIYLTVDRNARECIMEEQEFSDSSDINFSLTYEDKTLEDFIIEIDVRDEDESHHNYSFLVDPQQESVNKDIKVGQNNKILNILLGYGVANHENSGEQPVQNPDSVRKEVGIEYSTAAWPEGSPEEIWWIIKDGEVVTDEASQAIRNSCEYFFPGVPITIMDNYEIPIPNNIFLIQKAVNQAGAAMSFWCKNYYEYGTNYVRIGLVYLHYDSTGTINQEIGTVAEAAAEPQIILRKNSIFSGNEEITPCDEAVFAIKHNQEPEVGWVVIYEGDPGSYPGNETKVSWVANATISADRRTVYVLPKREEF
ncbi:hypothetical protein HWHPT5561_08310 [Petrotoga sp. HWH.PT.55.6.1]|jgi:hypothetical protein|uniref:Ig-like domain-containing protein n=1 Tax=unclassified Petrotoga TaxID=2620614 RepID=UPI000CA03C1C|nr:MULTISPECIES: hypothetical protein [unclassified Petrotoga]PNR94406.1 hypothetical protein X926_00085 [Petrotoga sp. HWHPT.55.6.3]RPD35330.1 hypothetical protein HWHPT5561_08310 [Petrotoga sp. HWH.PT.55.6.1]